MHSGDQRVHMIKSVEFAETDPHCPFWKSPDGPVRCRGAMQPSAYGNPKRLVEDRPREGDVRGIEPKRDDTGAGRRVTKDTHTINLAQPVRQHPRECGLVLCDGVYSGSSDEADSSGQPGDARQVDTARLEPPR